MSISKSYNKQNDTTYVYEVIENYWDKEKKQSRSKRKLIGKIDPATGKMIPTTPRKKFQDTKEGDYKSLYESAKKEIAQKERRISELEGVIEQYLADESEFLRELEDVTKRRRGKTDDLIRKHSSHG